MLRAYDKAKAPPSTEVQTSTAKTFSLEKLVHNIFLLATTHTTLDIVKAKSKRMLHIVGRRELLLCLFVCWRRDVMFTNLHFALHKVHVLACIAQHRLAKLGGIRKYIW